MAERYPCGAIGDTPTTSNEIIANFCGSGKTEEENGGRTDISITSSLNSVLHRVEAMFGVLTNEIASIKASVEEIKVEMVSHDNACSKVLQYIAPIKNDLTHMKETVDDVECGISLAVSNTTAVRNTNQTMSKELATIKKSLDEHNSTLSLNQQVLKSIKTSSYIISGKLSRVQLSIDKFEDLPKNEKSFNRNNESLTNELSEVKKILNKQKSDSLSHHKALMRELNNGLNSSSQEISSMKLAIETLKNELKMEDLNELHKMLSEELSLVKNYMVEHNPNLSHGKELDNDQDKKSEKVERDNQDCCSPMVAEMDSTVVYDDECETLTSALDRNADGSDKSDPVDLTSSSKPADAMNDDSQIPSDL